MLNINYTCLYGDYKNDDNVMDLMKIVLQKQTFTESQKKLVDDKNNVCQMLHNNVRIEENMVDACYPTILIRDGPVVVGFVEIDLEGDVRILQHICTVKGYGSVAMGIAENVMTTPCEALEDYCYKRIEVDKDITEDEIDNFLNSNVIKLTDITKPHQGEQSFYEKCGYQRDPHNSKDMVKTLTEVYIERLSKFLEDEGIHYEDIDTFQRGLVENDTDKIRLKKEYRLLQQTT